MANENLPHWDLSNVYPGLDSRELADGMKALSVLLGSIEELTAKRLSSTTAASPVDDLARIVDTAIDLFNAAYRDTTTITVYIDSFVSTDSYNTTAVRMMSECEQLQVRLKQQWTRFQAWLGGIASVMPEALAGSANGRSHSFVLTEAAGQARYLMSDPEEMLAAELSLSGANAWGKLQRTVTSQITVDFELDGKTEALPMPALINLRTHPDEAVRRRAYETEMREWEKVKEPLAACLNGVKGTAVVLARKRGRPDSLHEAVDMARIDAATLEALLGAMRDSLPLFRRYFARKAQRLGKNQLAWWDLFAPTGKPGGSFSWGEARAFILENFGRFSPRLRTFAEHAFNSRWIDAEPRDGKAGGGFCAPLPRVKESRILVNFDGSFELVATVAHELGHAFHAECAYAAGKTDLQSITPMTLAETASIMCETVINEAVLAAAKDPQERLALLESSLIGEAQTIVDIYSRFLFEKEVMERRAKAELSAADFCDAMERAQEASYGEGLDPRFRHRSMWTWKPHYYAADLNFYNFPYAFGQLFGAGLYALYRKRGPAFLSDYEGLLATTGEGTAADLAARFGMDLRSRAFWDGSVGVIRDRIERYCAL
jgi:pepF/M3 family oligoendopeptidase